MATIVKQKLELTMTTEFEHSQSDALEILIQEFMNYLKAAEPYLAQPLERRTLLSKFEQQLVAAFAESDPEAPSADEPEDAASETTWEELDTLLMPALPSDWEMLDTIRIGDAVGLELARILETNLPKAQHTLFQTNLSQLHLLLMHELGVTFVDPRDLRTGAERFIHEAVRRRLFKTAPSAFLVKEPVRSYKNKLLDKARVRDPYDPDKVNEYFFFVPGTGERQAIRKAYNLGIAEMQLFQEAAQRVKDRFPNEVAQLQALSHEVENAPKVTEEPSQSSS